MLIKRVRKCLALWALLSTAASPAIIRGLKKNREILSIVKDRVASWDKQAVSKDDIVRKYHVKNIKKVIKTILHSFGYFDAEVEVSFQKNNIVYDIKLNERYKFNEVLLAYVDNEHFKSGLTMKQVFDFIGVNVDSYTDTKQLGNASAKIANYFENLGFAFIEVKQPELVIDRLRKKIKARYKITLNGKVTIGKTVVNAKRKSLEPFVQNRLMWRDGEVYSKTKIEDTKSALMDSGCFSNVDVALEKPASLETAAEAVCTTATVNIEEALPRAVAAGCTYSTSEKFGLKLSWTHYNIDGKGSKLATLLDVSKRTKAAKLQYDVPDVFGKRQILASQVGFTHESAAAYDVLKLAAQSILWQSIGRHFKVGIGGICERSTTKDAIVEKHDDRKSTTKDVAADVENAGAGVNDAKTDKYHKVKFRAFGVPMNVEFNTTDSFLDPQKGVKCLGTTTTYFGNLKPLAILEGRLAFYCQLSDKILNNSVIATYAKVGSILMNKKCAVPRDKLLFAGGAGSVRGYGFQMIGAVNRDKKPLGGRSCFEFGIEPRWRVSEDVGLVVFFEGGNVRKSSAPRPFTSMMYGYGFGVRYYTSLGPIRVDVAFPVKKRRLKSGKKIDGAICLYVSIGQAF